MSTIVVPLADIITDPDHPIDLASLSAEEAVLRIKDIYGFLASAVDVTIDQGIATITLTEEKGQRASQALRDIERASDLARRGRLAPAIDVFRRALTVLPEHTTARRELAMALMESGDAAAAKKHLIRVLQLDPNDAWAYLVLGNLYLKAEGDLGSADRYYQSALDLAPDDPYIVNSYASLVAMRQNSEEAERLFQRAIELSPDYPNPRHGLALSYVSQGNLSAARDTLEDLFSRVESDDPRHASVYEESHKLYREIRRQQAAAQSDENMRRLERVLADYTKQSGYEVRLQEDATLATTAKVEAAWRYGRSYHLLKFKPGQPAVLPYLIAHEFEHVLMIEEAQAVGRNRSTFTASEHVALARRTLEKDTRRIMKRRRMDEKVVDQYITHLIEGVVNQLYNAPLDMVVESRIHERHPYLHDSQFTGMADEHETNLRAVADKTIREMSPTRIYQANVAMNAASALFFDGLFDNVTAYSSQYR